MNEKDQMTYCGYPHDQSGSIKRVVIEKTGVLQHRVRHSPDGLTWGYNGSAPSDLALSLLWDWAGTEPCASLYINFRRQVLATQTAAEALIITGKQIREFVEANPVIASFRCPVDGCGGWRLMPDSVCVACSEVVRRGSTLHGELVSALKTSGPLDPCLVDQARRTIAALLMVIDAEKAGPSSGASS